LEVACAGPIKIHVGICRAGVAGPTASIALLKLPNIHVEIYEKATTLREIGASITLGPDGLRTLQRLGIDNCISDEVTYRGPVNIPIIYRYWKTNDILGLYYHREVNEYLHLTARYYRAHLQEELLKHVPNDTIHLRKKFIAAHIDAAGVVLQFEDGKNARVDILVGADGLRSVSYINLPYWLGVIHPETRHFHIE
jgi:salicylate hydroxylase